MKLLALAAVLAMGSPALAQTVPQDRMGDGTTNPVPAMQSPPPVMSQDRPMVAPPAAEIAPRSTQPMPQHREAMGGPFEQPPQQPMGSDDQATTMPAQRPMTQQPMSGTTSREDAARMGGYQPSGSPLSGTPSAGAQVTVRPSMSVEQAFPAPAPQESYPVCSRTVRDQCRQPGG